MLGLAEYIAQSAQLDALGQQYDEMIAKIDRKLTTQEIKQITKAYILEYRQLLLDSLREVAANAMGHYGKELGVEFHADYPDLIVNDVFAAQYYGASLNQRLAVQARQVERRLTQANLMGVAAQTFTSHIAGGSQTLADRRLLLGMLSKIENEAAKKAADEADVKLIRWTLSHRHAKPDPCDDLATSVDNRVVSYLKEHNFNEDPKGLYFAEELPDPPHPNCQCEYSLTIPNVRRTETLVQRTANKIRSILRRIRGR